MRSLALDVLRASRLALLLTLALALSTPAAAEEAAELPPERDERAVQLLLSSAEHLAAASTVRVRLDAAFDVVQEWGQKLEFGGTRLVSLRRPDRARVETTSRGGEHGTFVFDGQRIWLHDRAQRVYASAPAPDEDDIDSALAFAVEVLGTPIPIVQLFRADLPAFLSERIQSATYVGEDVIDGTRCHHLAIEGPEADAQFWIPVAGEPLPRRIVVGYPDLDGQPQFRAQFESWELGASIPDTLFTFQPPEGDTRIPFVTIEPLFQEEVEPEEQGSE